MRITLAFLLLLTPQQAEKKYAQGAGLELTTSRVINDGKLVFNEIGGSTATATFTTPAAPSSATLELEHLSAGAGEAPLGGSSVISVVVNGAVAIAEWDIGSHSFIVERLRIDKFLKAGPNTIDIKFVKGTTTYWLKSLSVSCTFPAGTKFDEKVERIPADRKSDYAVVVTRRTWSDKDWRDAAETLAKKRDAVIIVCPGALAESKAELAAIAPRFACFVARPTEIGQSVVVALHRMMRTLDDDPYTDARWGIITGWDAADAKRLAARSEPLAVRRGLAGCGLDLDRFETGAWFSEGKQNLGMRKEKGGTPSEVKTPDDTTAAIIAEFNQGKPDLFLTSGHATERDWQIGYSYKNGQFRCQEGRIFGIDLANKAHAMESPNPKVYLASGNCRMGLVPDRDAMAVAFIHSAGVHQMIGYVVSTWYGAAGWGTRDYFMAAGLPLSDAAFANSQWMVWQLESRFPKTARVNYDTYDIESNPNLPNDLAKKHGLTDKDEVGLLWDRDTLALYGDPAWTAQLAVLAPPWTTTLTEKEGLFTFEAVSTIDGDWPRPPFAFLPRRVKGLRLIEGTGLAADDFVMLAAPGKMTKGQKVRAVFSAK